MWPFSKKRYSILESGLLEGMTDCHCHILPGVDDGIQTMDESLRALQKMSELGVREIWLTPHIMEDIPNRPADLRQRFEEVKSNLSPLTSHLSPLNIHLAAEHMLDTLFIQRLADDDLLPYQSSPLSPLTSHASPLLLVETSYFHPPMGLYNILENIRKKGYTPLLAHPERYMYMENSDYRSLQDMDIKLQLNILSLTGAYGETAARKAYHLLHQGAYSCLGTDLHNLNSFQEYAEVKCLTQKDITLLHSVQETFQ